MYRDLLDTPLSVSEEEAISRIAEANLITPDEAGRIITNVQKRTPETGGSGILHKDSPCLRLECNDTRVIASCSRVRRNEVVVTARRVNPNYAIECETCIVLS